MSFQSGSLADVKVIDLTRVLGGPYCTQLLGDHGAEIIKIEPPSGDETRGWGPPFKDGVSAYFSGVNRNKRSLGLDLTKPEGQQIVRRLLEGADVLIENFKSGTMERWGLGYEDVLRHQFPRLIYCHITGFGATGPLGGLPGYDIVMQAIAGLISVNGSDASGPMRLGIPLVDLGTGLMAAIGVLLALHRRSVTGQGEAVDVSLFDSAVSLLHPHMANYLMSGVTPQLTGNSHPNICPCDLYPTRTKSVLVVAGNERQFRRLCELLDRSDLAADPKFKTNSDRLAHRAELNEILTAAMRDVDGAELADKLIRGGVVAGALLSIAEIAEHPHTRHTEMIVERGSYRGTGIPIKMRTNPGSVRSAPPEFGSSNGEVLRSLGFTDEEVAAFVSCGAVVEAIAK